jgi:hypothetical protein
MHRIHQKAHTESQLTNSVVIRISRAVDKTSSGTEIPRYLETGVHRCHPSDRVLN